MTDHTGVIDIARNGVDEVIRLRRENASLRALLAEARDCVAEELNHLQTSRARQRYIDYNQSLLERIDAAIGEGGGNG